MVVVSDLKDMLNKTKNQYSDKIAYKIKIKVQLYKIHLIIYLQNIFIER